jgi:uncharacterized integral membrane protein
MKSTRVSEAINGSWTRLGIALMRFTNLTGIIFKEVSVFTKFKAA